MLTASQPFEEAHERVAEGQRQAPVARALYDNEAEWPNELKFKKGDLLYLLDSPMSGWWSCADQYGNRGIAPANRLELVDSTYEATNSDDSSTNYKLTLDSSDLESDQSVSSMYSVDKNCKGDSYPNDTSFAESVYDVPTRMRWGQRSVVRNVPIKIEGRAMQQQPSKEAKIASNGSACCNGSENVSTRKPPDSLRTADPSFYSSVGRPLAKCVEGRTRLPCSSSSSSPSSSSSSSMVVNSLAELKLSTVAVDAGVADTSSPVDQSCLYDIPSTVCRNFLQSNVVTEGRRDATYAQPARKMLPQIFQSDGSRPFTDILVLYGRLKSSIDQLANEELLNASRWLSEHSVGTLDSRCHEASTICQQLFQLFEQSGSHASNADAFQDCVRCALNVYSATCEQSKVGNWMSSKIESLSQFIDVAKEALRHLQAFIIVSSSSPSNFQSQSSPRGDRRTQVKNGMRSLFDDDYDFVESVVPAYCSRPTSEVKREGGDKADFGDEAAHKRLDSENVEILKFYSPQINAHAQCLSNLIDAFLTTIENNQPPRVFIGQIKFIVLTAHKLVYIGDNISLCLHCNVVSSSARRLSDELCQDLRTLVSSAKLASHNYPAVTHIQAMIKSVVAVSKTAQQIRLLVEGCLAYAH